MRRALPLIAIAAIAAPVVAQQMTMPTSQPGKPDPTLARSGRYTIDTPHTQALFSVNHLGFTHYSGQLTNPSGSLVLDTKTPANSTVMISFPVAQVRTTVAALDSELQGEKFFDAAKFPAVTFASTRVTRTGPSDAMITGDLTIRGVTRPVILTAHFVGAGQEFWGDKKQAIGFTATTSVKRSDFGMGDGIPLVSDAVEITINAGFEAA